MVKGITRRVIVVKSPGGRLFDEAIFIVREGALDSAGLTGDDIIKEAQNVADTYIRSNLRSGGLKAIKLPPFAFALAGALFTGLLWLLSFLLV